MLASAEKKDLRRKAAERSGNEEGEKKASNVTVVCTEPFKKVWTGKNLSVVDEEDRELSVGRFSPLFRSAYY